RIAQEHGIVPASGQLSVALVEPVIVAQVMWHPVIGFEGKWLNSFPDHRSEPDEQHREHTNAQPLPACQAEAVGERDRIGLRRPQMLLLAVSLSHRSLRVRGFRTGN